MTPESAASTMRPLPPALRENPENPENPWTRPDPFASAPRLRSSCPEDRWHCRLSLRAKLAALVALLGVFAVTLHLLLLITVERHHPHPPDIRTSFGLLGLTLFLRVFAVYYLALLITRPLTHLSTVAHAITARRDYSVRAQRTTGGEIGVLTDAFNQLLDRIQQEDRIREATEQRLRRSEERYALAARGANDGLWDYDATTGFSYISPRLNAMYGEPAAESWMTMQDWIDRIHPADRGGVLAEIATFSQTGQPTLRLEYRIRCADGSYRWMLSHGAAVRDANGVPLRMAGSQTDITEAKTTDAVTGLPNRFFFLDALNEALRRDPAQVAVLFIDIENFTLFTGSLGRPAGEDLLIQVAARLRTLARLNSAPPGSTTACVGDDEFAILLAPMDAESAASAAARILETLREPFFIEDQRIYASASIGIAQGAAGADPETVLRDAQTAMVHAAMKGRAQCAVFRPDMRTSAAIRREVVTGLRRAIDLNQLRLHYQPLVDVSQRRIVGFESLVRWQHPERGLLPPGVFIPVAEESDLILDVGQWVLREACRQMAEWHERFPSSPPFAIGVNLSARQMNDPHFADEVSLVLRQSGLDPRNLRLEVTETALLGRSDNVLATLHALERMHIGLVIDDFGTGYSSLSYLRRLPFTVLKIDRSFVQELDDTDGSAEIVRTILHLGRSLRMRVVAEGVETPEQLARITTLGCDLIQGYYFSPPLDAEQAEALLRRPQSILSACPAVPKTPEEVSNWQQEERSTLALVPAPRADAHLACGH